MKCTEPAQITPLRLIALPTLPPAWRAHGLTYAQRADLAADVVIRFGPTPLGLRRPAPSSQRVQIHDGEWLLHLGPDVRILASRGREITVDAPGTHRPTEIAAWVQGPATVAVLYQRGLVPFHASAVSFGSRIVMFVGPSGAGKSSLAAACVAAGAQFVTDDVLVISEGADGALVGHPGPAFLRLDASAVERGEWQRLRWECADHDGKQLAVPTDGGMAGPQRVGAVVVLGFGESLSAAPIDNLGIHLRPDTLLHRPRLSTTLGASAVALRVVASLTREVPAWQLLRPASEWTLQECADCIRRLLPGAVAET